MGKKHRNKPNNFFNSLVFKKKLLLKKVENFLIKEIKEDDFDVILNSIRNKFKFKEYIAEEIKIFLVGIFIVCSAMWIENNGIIQVAHSEDLKIANAHAMEETEASLPPEGENQKIDAKALNQYKLIPPEKKCEEDKSQRKSSDLCGKDDEEELKKIEKERKEKMARAIASQKPRIRGPQPYIYDKDSLGRKVCNKKNDHPSKSDNNKKGHMDMECCLDPDEIPNPNCYYDPAKYGKYLN